MLVPNLYFGPLGPILSNVLIFITLIKIILNREKKISLTNLMKVIYIYNDVFIFI